MSEQNHWKWAPNFANTGTLPTSGPSENGLIIAETSAVGTPVFRYKDGASEGGEVELAFDSQAEAQNVCLYHGDTLPFDIDRIVEALFRFKLKQAALNAATMIALGLIGDRNDAIDTIAQAALMRIIGADDTTAVVIESDDGTVNLDDQSTGKSIADTNLHTFGISFALGKKDVRFFLDGQPVAQGITFDMSNYSGALQFCCQIQKTSDANVDGINLLPPIVRGRAVL